ncbi:MAG TPA: integration host factor subunit beta [Planctomycetes bacterium]|nr:integration host factor subunit beta [Planctomycetota bacterium]
MATVSKKEIVKTVSEKHGLTTTQTSQIVQVFMNQIIDELARGNRIEFREFGIFELKRRKPRIARNPKTGDQVEVPEKTVVTFKPGKVMKARVVDTLPAPKGKKRSSSAAAAPAPKPAPLPSPAIPTPRPAAQVEPVAAPPPPPPPPPPEPKPEPKPLPPPPPSPSSFY